MKDKRALILRLMAVTLIIAAAVMGDRSVTTMLCGAGMLGITANKLDGGAGCIGNIIKKR